MARTVYVPEAGGALNFADGTSDQQIIDYVRAKYAPAPAPAPTEAGIGALESGLYGFRSRSQAGLGKAFQSLGWEDSAKYLFDQSRANERLASSYKPEIADVSQIQSASDAAKFAGSTIGQSAAETATGAAGIYAGAAAGATVGSVVPVVGTVAGGIIGSVIGFAISSLPSFVGGNLQEQVKENNVTLEEASGYSAGVGAVAQAPLDFIFDRMIARRLPGGGAALDIAKKGFLQEVAKTAGKGALTEGLTEPAQQAIQIAQANPEKLLEFGPEVQREIINAAAAGVLSGGVIGGAAGGIGSAVSGVAPKETPAQSELSADYAAAAQRGADMVKFSEINTGVEKLSAENAIGVLRMGKVRINPTPENGLKSPVDRFQILDGKGKSIAEFSDPVNAADAVNQYSKIVGKKIDLQNITTGTAVPTATTPAGKAPPPTAPIPTVVPEATVKPAAAAKPPTQKALDKSPLAVRMQAIASDEIPYDTLTWDDNKKKALPSSGKSKVVDYGGRKIVVADVNGVKVPFYLSSGFAGKSKVPSGKWYPFFGIGADGWINKTSQEEIARYYDDPDLARVSQTLDATIGDIRADQSIPKVGMSGSHMGFINSGLDPSENNTTETGTKVNANIRRILDKLQQTRPAKSEEIIGAADPALDEGIDAVSDAVPIEMVPPEIVVGVGIDEAVQAPIVNEEEQARVRKFIEDRKSKVASAVGESLRRYNLKDVQTKFVSAFQNAMGKNIAVEGTEEVSGDKSIVTLATNIYDPNLTVEQMVDKVLDVLNHETIHSLFDLGLIRPSERTVLLNAVETAKVPGKKYTYLDYAKLVYDSSKPGMEIYENPELVAEEAVAEMFRDWRKRNTGAPPNTRGLFNRVIDTLRHMFNSMRRNRYEDIFAKAESGELGERGRKPVSEMASAAKLSTAPTRIKLNKNSERPDWDAIMDDIEKGSTPHPFSRNERVFEDIATFDASPFGNSLHLGDIRALKPNQGSATKLIDFLKSIADKHGIPITGVAKAYHKSPGYISDTEKLVNWYANRGFEIGDGDPDYGYEIKYAPSKQKFSMAPEFPDLSVAPNYPYGRQVPGVNAAQINNVLDHVTYGAGVDMLDRLFNSQTASSIIPDRFRPSKAATTNFIQKFADRMLPVGQMVDYIKQNGGTVPDAFDAYMAEELMHGRVADSLESREEDLYNPLMKYIKGTGLSMDDFEAYLYARHAKERNQRIREINPNSDPAIGSGMSDEEADQILSSVNGSAQREQYLTAEQMFRTIIEDTNRLRVESGLTPDFDGMTIEDENGNPVELRAYEFYAPLRGFADESRTEGEVEDELRARIGRGFKIRGREDMRAFGRRSKATDLVAHAILQNTEAVIRAAKNRVGQSFLGLVEANPEFAEQYGVEVMSAGKKPLKKYISSKGVVKTMVDPMYKNSDDVMVVKRNGEEIPIRIDNRFLQKALLSKKSGNPDIAEKAVGVLQKVNRFLAAMNTAYNPEFLLVNFPRDLQTAMVNITQYEIDGIQAKVLKDALPAARGVHQMMRDPSAVNGWTDWYDMFKADGGKTSGFFGVFTLEERLKKLEKVAQDTSGQPSQRLKDSFEFIKKSIEDANGALENAVRLSVYKNLVEAGLSRERAAQAAKNLTVNFDKRGEYGPLLNSLYLFYNASVQGTLSMMMAASRSKRVRKVIGGIVVVGLMQDMINSLMSPEDDDGEKIYDKIPDYKLETNLILMDPFGTTENGYFAIPLPYGFNAFFNMGRALSRNLRGEYKTSEAATSMMSTFVDAFNPVGGTESFLNFISPTVLDPVVALSINQDFTGRRIYPEPFPGSVPKANSQTYWSTTSPIFKNTAYYLNWATGGTEYVPGLIDFSPDVMEYMYDYALGGVGAFGRRVFDTATSTLPQALSGDLTELEINNIPVLRKLYGNVSTRVTFEDYFDKVNHVLARGEELKSAIKEGNPDRIKSVRARFGDEIAIYPAVKSLANRRNKLAGELRKVRDNPRMPPEQKRRRQEFLQKQIEEITDRVTKLYESRIGDKYPSLFS